MQFQSNAGRRAVAAIAVVLGLLSGGSGLAGPAKAAEVRVEHAWARAPAVVGRAGAAFATLTNTGDQAASLVAARVEGVPRVELHRTRMADGVMTMAPQDSIPIPPDGTTRLAPGGYHLMLMNSPEGALEKGTVVPLTLEFADGTVVTVDARVVGPGEPAPVPARD